MFAKKLYLFVTTLMCFWGAASVADDYSNQWGPALGETLPLLEAIDNAGNTRVFEDLKGKNGLLLFMNRSADW